MHIMVIGLNYRTAPVELREKFSLSETAQREALTYLHGTRSILESVIVSTCNRTEIYALVTSLHAGTEFFQWFLARLAGVDRDSFTSHSYIYTGSDAVRHLFRVSAGLDSMVLGETQILGQVRNSYQLAHELGCIGSIFHTLFRKAVEVGKRAHTETQIGQNAVSVSYAAVELAKKIFSELSGKTMLIIGAGKMSELTAKHLNANGATKVLVANRTYERAQELADRFFGQALDLGRLDMALQEADIVISSTGSQGYVVERGQVSAIMKKRRNRPLFFIDIAVPRDLDPDLNKLDNVYLYDIDDLEHVIAANLEERAREAEKIGVIIAEELVAFRQWMNEQEVIPLITAMRGKGIAIQESVMDSLLNKLPGLSEREQKILQKHTMSIVNQLLRDPIVQLKQMATEADAAKNMDMACRLFGIQPDGETAKASESDERAAAQTQEKLQSAKDRSSFELGRLSSLFGEACPVTTLSP
ncbi:glutamyl-tRNA reductase [Fodinisporobacter ferrooxydans]|uniref:Glutamyl-tRNA reductase n=1 Tax=Fodinisporobacter ferrooxydans TaxID=2901836 RepID=A0ABY4CIA1_9BACL|nr:glutamyl-tRNA reductase [Alicyclobacillaceae bacterium MYW30-H2]